MDNKKRCQFKVVLDCNIIAHINLHQPQVSHYKLNTVHDKISFTTYLEVFGKKSVGFEAPSQVDCPKGTKNKQHLKENESSSTESHFPASNCNECIDFVNHRTIQIS